MGLEAVEIVMAIEEDFGVEFSDAEAGKLETVASMHMAILEKLRARGESPDEAAVFLQMQSIIAEQLGLRRDEVYPAAYFVRDLGVG